MGNLQNFSSLLDLNPLSVNPTKWSNTLKQFVGNWPTNCLSLFDHFVKLVLKGLKKCMQKGDFLDTTIGVVQNMFKKFIT